MYKAKLRHFDSEGKTIYLKDVDFWNASEETIPVLCVYWESHGREYQVELPLKDVRRCVR